LKPRIALIDSGIGGLSIFNQFIRHLGCVTYLADNKFFPYGTKKDSELINIVDRLIFYFLNQQYEKVILSCNTASLVYQKYLKYKYQDSVVSIIDQTIDDLENIKHLNHVGIIATDHVIESNIYSDLIKQKYEIESTSLKASDLVSSCEKNDQKAIKKYLHTHFHVFKEKEVSALILACTHFNLIENEIKAYFDGKVPIICSGYSILDQFRLNDLCLMCSQNIIFLTNYQKSYVDKIKFLFKDLKNIEIKELNI